MIRNRMPTILALLIYLIACQQQPNIKLSTNTESSPATGTRGMVSAAHPLATEAGLDILEQGGNAFDAAVAIAAVLNVVEPMMSGIGGYGTIVVYDAEEGKAHFLNCSARIPKATNSDLMRAPAPNYEQNRRGAKAVSTPGNVPAWAAMSERFGALPWENLFDRAIALADSGFELDERTASFIERAFPEFSEYSKAIYGENGEPLQAGGTLLQNDLANSFRLIAQNGAAVIQTGDLAQKIDAAMREADGFLTIDDLRASQGEWWKPISIDYRGYEVINASPPSTAFPSLIRLGLMSRFDVQSYGHNSTAFLHRFAEATKHAFWCRLRYAGDPDYNPPPLDRLLSENYWQEQVAQIDPDEARSFVPPTQFSDAEMQHTTHFVVADRWGNIVSATQTLGNAFGSRIMPEGTGLWLNNSLAYCTFEPKGNPMDAHAGRHKLSGDCPTIILREGKPWVAIGTPGGHTIG
ncbi:MAG: gamma-glutamyltransferase family protein, partial [bacterium]